MNYNNVINWFFLPFLIVVLMLRTDGAKASHMWCGVLTPIVLSVKYRVVAHRVELCLPYFGSELYI